MKKELIASAILITAFCAYLDFLVPEDLWLSLIQTAFENDSFRFILAIVLIPLAVTFVGLHIEDHLWRKKFYAKTHSNRVCCNFPERLSEKHNG